MTYLENKNSLFQVEKISFTFNLQICPKNMCKILQCKKALICTSFCGAKKQCKFFHNNVRKFLHLHNFSHIFAETKAKKMMDPICFICCMWPWWIVMGAWISIFCHDCIKVTHSGMPSPCCLVHLELQQGGRSITPRTILYANQPFHPTTQPLNHYPKVNHHALRHPTKVAPGQPLLSTILLHPRYQHQRCS